MKINKNRDRENLYDKKEKQHNCFNKEITKLISTKRINWYIQSPMQIIFCIGGIGYNEIRSLNNNKFINQSNLVMVGSTALLKPNDYVNELIKLNSI